jgi:hypothetical protein
MNFCKASLLAGVLLIPLAGHAGTSQQDYAAAHPRFIECGPAQAVTMDKAGVIHVVNVCPAGATHEPMTPEAYSAWQVARANAVRDESWDSQQKEGAERQKLGRLADAYEVELSHMPPMRAAWFKSLPKPDQHFMMCLLLFGDNKAVEADAEGCGDVSGAKDQELKATLARLKISTEDWDHSHVVINAHLGEPCVFGFQDGHPPTAADRTDMTKACDSGNRGRALTSAIGPTPRDIAGMSPMERQHNVCEQIRGKISVQQDLQASGSSGYYNLDTLRALELANCGSNQEP